MLEHWGEILRLVNLNLGVALLYLCMMRLVRDWSKWTRRERLVRVHLTAYLFVMCVGTAEQLASGTRPGLRAVLVVLVHASFLVALLRSRHDRVRESI